MNKVIALTLLLCLFGGSYATILVQYYDGAGCLAKNFVAEVIVTNDASTCAEFVATTLYGTVSSTFVLISKTGTSCTGTTSETGLQLVADTCVTGTVDATKSYKYVTATAKPSLYLSVYTAATLSQANFLYKGTLQIDTCKDLTTVSAGYAKVVRSSATFTVTFYAAADTSCGSTATLTATAITVDDVAVVSGSYYYALSAAVKAYTTPTLHVSAYNSSTCTAATTLTSEQTVSTTCAVETADSTKYTKVAYAFPSYTLSYGCAATCVAPCDILTTAVIVNGACIANSGATAWYKVSTTALDPNADDSDASSILSFAALALCALFALLF